MFKCYLQRCEFNFLFEVFCHKVPPHDCAAGVRTKNRHKKKKVIHPFGFCRERTDPREVALCVNLFTTTQHVQFGRSVEAQSAAAHLCGRGTSPKQVQKKERFHVLFGAPLDKMDE